MERGRRFHAKAASPGKLQQEGFPVKDYRPLFALLEGALLKTLAGVDQQFDTFGTKPISPMMAAAVEAYLGRRSLAFPVRPGACLTHCEPILPQRHAAFHCAEWRAIPK